jgi:hypothetical protein
MSTTGREGRLRRQGVLALALAVAAAGLVLIGVAVHAQQSAPQAPRSLGRIDPPSSSGSPSTSAEQAAPGPLGPSRPVRIRIPSIGVNTVVNPIGKNKDGTLAVPQPGRRLDQAAWYDGSPTPGQPGPAIIEGHVDSVEGPSVFFRLGALRPGQKVQVTRSDGLRLEFVVDAVRDFPKTSFPTSLVYGGKNLSRPSLRLITCSNFDESTHHHVGNEVVFLHLSRVSGHRASS